MTSRLDNFTLDHCYCRISIRKVCRENKCSINRKKIISQEGRGRRSYEKIGYYEFDLASVTGSGDESKTCLLNGYQQTNSSPANAYLEIRMKLAILEGDQIFRRFLSENFSNKIFSFFFLNISDSAHHSNKVDQTRKNATHDPFSGLFIHCDIDKKKEKCL